MRQASQPIEALTVFNRAPFRAYFISNKKKHKTEQDKSINICKTTIKGFFTLLQIRLRQADFHHHSSQSTFIESMLLLSPRSM